MEDHMKSEQLYQMLELPGAVRDAMNFYRTTRNTVLDNEIRQRLAERESWDTALQEIRNRIGEDPSGFYILCELMRCACDTYEKYKKMRIDDSVFTATMKFCTRFLEEHKKIYGAYAFTWAWWFPRQLALQEFRIGELEYEFISSDERKIYIHIPSDANLTPSAVRSSLDRFQEFLSNYFPDWIGTDWYCESWMLSPALAGLLPDDSNLLQFQKLFDVISTDYESMAVLDWVFPGEGPELENLSEKTSLQKKLKEFLISGQKFGWAEGILRL